MNTLNAISPVDGRYRSKCEPLAAYFSEEALIRYRVRVEVEYFIALLQRLGRWHEVAHCEASLRAIYQQFSTADAAEVKEIEQTTNHDVKAVEYFIKRRIDAMGLPQLDSLREFVHFGLTSQDINNTSVPLSMRECHEALLLPRYEAIAALIEQRAREWADVPMLAHTHGQPASPTHLGKELMVFVYRLRKQLETFRNTVFEAKFGGATGNFNAHLAAYPDIDWIGFADSFVADRLGLARQRYTTQIENYDQMAAYFDNCKRLNVVLIDFARDVWSYISMDYFKQRIKAGEVGSSAMPHKVNPIDFENAEGNLGLANAIFEHLSHKLPVSRLQRDLTDSTVSRNIGVPVAHTLIALASLEKGIGKLLLHRETIERDLADNQAVLAEAIQTILRSVGYPNAYEALKELTRTGERVSPETIARFVDTLQVDDELKQRIRSLSPQTYTGYGI